MKKRSSRHPTGFTLVETLIAMTITGIIGLGLAYMMNYMALTALRAKEQTAAAGLSQKFFARLNSIPYAYVFSCDSSSATYGLTGNFGPVTSQTTYYPYVAILNDFKTELAALNMTRFTLSTRFMIRDLGDLNNDGLTTDLRYYADVNGDLADDYDSALRYYDQNSDGNYFDTYGSPETTEEPHTRLKEATLKIYKRNRLIFEETQLISWEKLTGAEGKAAGATLSLVISTPSENSAVYDLTTTARQNSFNMSLSASYPVDIRSVRGDSLSPLRILGETTPSSTLSWKLSASTNPVLDTCTADFLGGFDCMAATLTSNLTEGQHTLWGQATKDAYYSPWSPVTIIRDINPPTISNTIPTGSVPTKRPVVRASFIDTPVASGKQVSGINESVIGLFLGTAPIPYQYDAINGYVTWVDSTTGNPPLLSTGTYTVILEGGDNAKYKARSTWTFTLDLADFTDHSAPSVDNKTPSGFSASNPPLIYCDIKDNQSGIDLETVTLKLDGVTVVSLALGNLYSASSVLTQQDGYRILYIPDAVLSPGWHSVTISGNHWATNPANKITTEETWNFSVP